MGNFHVVDSTKTRRQLDDNFKCRNLKLKAEPGPGFRRERVRAAPLFNNHMPFPPPSHQLSRSHVYLIVVHDDHDHLLDDDGTEHDGEQT